MADDSDQKLWVRVVDGLKKKPAYLLVFAVCALFFLSALATTIKGIASTDYTSLVVGSLSFAIALVVVFFVVRQVESNELNRLKSDFERLQQEKQQTNFPNQVRERIAQFIDESESKEVIDDFEAILDSLIEAVQYRHRTFTAIILERSNNWRGIAADWKNGQYFANDDYNDVLERIYAQAETSIFATSDATYVSIWKSPTGDRILRIHENGKAFVTRVFLFDNRNELTEEIMDIMKKHAAARVRVLGYFDDEFEKYDFPTELKRDFSIIDEGEVIGITEGVIGETAQARWFFKDKNRIGQYDNIKEKLINGSKNLEEISQWWDKNRTSTTIP